MKKLIIMIAILLAALLLTACEGADTPATTPNTDVGGDATHTHAFGEWQTVNGSTCTAEGEAERLCECGERETKKLDKLEHTYAQTVIEPTCTKDGYTLYECACGDSYNDNKTEKTGHSFGEWEVLTAPTCQEKGVEIAKCKNCEYSEAQETDKVDHTYGDWAESLKPTCEAKGAEARTCVYGCGQAETRETDSLGGHKLGEWAVFSPATCTEDGEERRVCRNAGCEHYESKTVNKGHAMSEWSVAVAPTCEAKGEERRECANCTYYETKEIESLGGHVFGEWTTFADATCTEDGEKRRTCQNAGCEAFESETVAGGHELGAWYTNVAATCVTQGEDRRECKNCSYYEVQSLPSEGHSWGEWYVASFVEEERFCDVCYDIETRIQSGGRSNAIGVAEIQIVNTPYQAGSTVHPYRRQGGCYNGVNAYQVLITKNEECGKIAKKNVITGETTFSEYVNIGHGDDLFYLPTTNCIYVGSGSEHHVFDADTLEYKGKQTLGNSTGCLFYMPSTNTYINSSGTVYDANFKKISSVSKQAGENIGKTVQGHCADENYIYELRCQGIGGEKYYTYIQIHTTSGKYVGTVTVKIPENFEPENISVVDGELYIAACSTQPVVTFYKVVFD